jgi:hypothetical protein
LADGQLAAGTDWVLVVVSVLVALAAVLVCVAAAIAIRRSLIERAGSIDCGLRRRTDRRWLLGLAEYEPDELHWHPVFGVRLRPAMVFSRRTLSVVARREPSLEETARLGPGTVVVECDTGSAVGRVELALSEQALTGFLAWMEAAPPGTGGGF